MELYYLIILLREDRDPHLTPGYSTGWCACTGTVSHSTVAWKPTRIGILVLAARRTGKERGGLLRQVVVAKRDLGCRRQVLLLRRRVVGAGGGIAATPASLGRLVGQ